jgi:hypothetical protein
MPVTEGRQGRTALFKGAKLPFVKVRVKYNFANSGVQSLPQLGAQTVDDFLDIDDCHT